MAQKIIDTCKATKLEEIELVFDYTNTAKNIAAIEGFVGQSGYICKSNVLSITSLQLEEFIQLQWYHKYWTLLDKHQCERFFSIPATINNSAIAVPLNVSLKLAEQI
ncbi:MAG: hypothetical protein IPO47_13375 [Bacteroidetes bacterium]|nr:hypothetical protein [Bacteroidota bacterium]